MSNDCINLCASSSSGFDTYTPWLLAVLGAILIALIAVRLAWPLIQSMWTRQPPTPAPQPPQENQDLVFLRKHGVLSWNKRRADLLNTDQRWRPNFEGIDFTKEKNQRRSRIWGKPVDLVGHERVVLTDIELDYAVLRGCQLGAAEGAPRSHPGADMRRAKLHRADLRSIQSTKASGEPTEKPTNLRRVNFERAVLTEASLNGADARGANFARAKLMKADLTGARLDGANFAWADLTGAIITHEGLKDAKLFGAKLAHANIDGINPRWLIMGRQLLGNRVSLGSPIRAEEQPLEKRPSHISRRQPA